MDAAFADFPYQRAFATPRQVGAVLLVMATLAFVTFCLVRFGAPGALVRPINQQLMITAVCGGGIVGVLLSIGVSLHRDPVVCGDPVASGLGLMFVASVFFGSAAWVLVQLGTQAVAFVGFPSPPMARTAFDVVGRQHLKGGEYVLKARLGADGREFDLPVDYNLYDGAVPGEMVLLPVQTGRFGIQRALLPRVTTSDIAFATR